ncbi:MAG: Hpt domain-containing protein, partial [Gammaproteobacteria bacterium]
LSLDSIEQSEADVVDHIETGEGLTLDGFDAEPAMASSESIEADVETLDSTLSDTPDTTAVQDFVSSGEVEPQARVPEQAPVPEPPVVQEYEVSDDIDDEIIEIFLEEAEEEYANIKRLLPQWETNLADEEALKDMRRSFHTLKGSGRLVGAADVGEFAWAFENMLNRVIDHTVEATPTMFEVLHRGRDLLPALFNLFKTQSKPGQDVLTLMSYADALSKGEDVYLEEPEKEPVIIEPEISNVSSEQAEEEAGASLNIDPVLLDIYRKEAETHIATLRSYIAGWQSGQEKTATYPLLRALHTLNGSSRTAGVQPLSEVCGAFENYVKDIQEKPFSEQALRTLIQLVAFVEQIMKMLDQQGVAIPDNSELMTAINSLAGVEEQQATDDTVIAGDFSVEEDIELSVEDDSVILDIDSEVSLEQPADFASLDDIGEHTGEAEPLGADYDEELLEIFIEEGEEILDECDNTLHQWEKTPDDSELVEALQRQLHTLKGGARMAGISEIGDLGHDIESMLTAVVDGHIVVSKDMQKVLVRAQDRLVSMLEQVKSHLRPSPANDLIAEVNRILKGPTVEQIEEVEHPIEIIDVAEPTEDNIEIEISDDFDAEAEAPVEETIEILDEASTTSLDELDKLDNVVPLESQQVDLEQPVIEESIPAAIESEPLPEVPGAGELQVEEDGGDRRKGSRIQHEQIRVRSDLLDNLVNFAGEVSIYRSRMEQQTNTFRFNLQELDDTISRFREQLRQFEMEAEAQIQYRKEDTLAQGYEDFDPLEMDRFTQMQHLSRGMLESLGDLDSLRSILSNITRESETLLVQQSRVTSELQEGLMRTRMVQVSGQAPRLRRIVRQTSDEMGKVVEVHMHGMDNELDRNVLDRVIPPVEHMLRNAIAHGIEKPELRKQAGKPESGNINISFNREGGEFVIRISDDGAGINLDAIRDKAIEKGMISANAQPSKEALLDLMMQSGFSTAEEITQIAGRGVGMDVVSTEIKQLGGHLQIDTEKGKGTLFTINMPLTLAVSRALMVNIGDETYAIPLLSVEGVERVNQDELLEMAQSDEPVYHWVGNDYKFMHLSSAMGMHQPIVYDENKSVPILLVRSGEYRAAIQVDRLIGSREIVVKPIGPQFSNLRGVSGATIMGDGRVVLIIDPAILVRLAATEDMQPPEETVIEEVVEEETPPTVMIVDDSITVRKVTTRFLERNDMGVLTAKDGVDALQQLQLDENIPDVMLLDVEMPRMDGFELATNIRNDERLKNIPIIMITSRTGGKHRDRAMNIGVNVYLGKPYNEAELLENIHTLSGK